MEWKWISIKDEMPIKESEGLVYENYEVLVSNGTQVWAGMVSAGNQPEFWCSFFYPGVTHWQRLPDPPEEPQDA